MYHHPPPKACRGGSTSISKRYGGASNRGPGKPQGSWQRKSPHLTHPPSTLSHHSHH